MVSEIAHVVSRKPDGPRGNHTLPLDARDRYDNLILLCEEHHKIVDANPEAYPVERLRVYPENRAPGQAKGDSRPSGRKYLA